MFSCHYRSYPSSRCSVSGMYSWKFVPAATNLPTYGDDSQRGVWTLFASVTKCNDWQNRLWRCVPIWSVLHCTVWWWRLYFCSWNLFLKLPFLVRNTFFIDKSVCGVCWYGREEPCWWWWCVWESVYEEDGPFQKCSLPGRLLLFPEKVLVLFHFSPTIYRVVHKSGCV